MNFFTSAQNRQRGVALLVALLVVALATVLIAALLDRGELTAARTRNGLRAAQAESYSLGLEAFAAHVLLQDAAGGSRNDTTGDIWAVPLPPTPVPGGEIAATMSDLDGRFNLNNLSPDYAQHAVWEPKFVQLLQALKLDPALMQVVRDWMSSTNASVQTGDAYYLAQPVPYRRSRGIFLHVSELRLLKGVNGEVYRQLAPYVSALPPGTPINVNTASVPVLMTLMSGENTTPITQQTAEALSQQGHANYQMLSELSANQPGLAPDCGALQATVCYGVTSTYFLARGQITLDDLPFVFYSLIERNTANNVGVHVIQRSRGADN